MKKKPSYKTYVALLRGINVGGHHKVPMADLRKEMETLGFRNVITLLNSGNVIFEATEQPPETMESNIASHLEVVFGFPIPILLREAGEILEFIEHDPFRGIEVTKDIRLYVTFLKQAPETDIALPWTSDDQSYRILDIRNRAIFSVLDVSVTKTPKGMDKLDKLFGNDITTRNWNTIHRIAGKM